MTIAARPFDSFQFHDNLVHGISFHVADFVCELILDIDHIVSWPDCDSAETELPCFSVAEASLKFSYVTDLVVHIDWGTKGYAAGTSGISINEITRETVITALHVPIYYQWYIRMTDEQSLISFGASSLSLELKGKPLTTNRQFLLDNERIKR